MSAWRLIPATRETIEDVMARANVPPGPRGPFLVGNTLQFLRDPLDFLTRAVRDYGDVVRLRLGNATYYLLAHPQDIEQVLRGQHQDFVKDKLTRLLSPVVGRGLLTSEGAFWRRQRKLANPAFQLQQVRRYGPVMVEQTERMLSTWREGQTLDIHREMTRLTLGIVGQTLFGTDVSSQAEEVGQALETVMEFFLRPTKWFRAVQYLPLPSTVRLRWAIRRLDRIIYGLIRRRRAEGTDPGDLLSRLLAAQDDQGSGMTDRQLRDEAVTLFLAGHETTALALSYTFYLLALNPESEGRLRTELEEVLGDRPPTVDDLPRLRYAEGVVRESLRLYPPAWSTGREPIRDVEIGGYPVPRGTQLFLSQWIVHRDPRWFTDPDHFRPERWADDLARRLPRCAYFPFGDGPRICIGQQFAMMEALLILATISQRFRLDLAPSATLELVPSITLRPRQGIAMIPQVRSSVAGRA